MYFTFSSLDVAVLILSIFGGMSIAFMFRSRIARFFFSIIVVIILVLSLIRGYSEGLENITWNLAYYIATNPVGLLGFVIGFILGFIIRKK